MQQPRTHRLTFCDAEALANLLEALDALLSFLAFGFFSLAGGQSGLGGATWERNSIMASLSTLPSCLIGASEPAGMRIKLGNSVMPYFSTASFSDFLIWATEMTPAKSMARALRVALTIPLSLNRMAFAPSLFSSSHSSRFLSVARLTMLGTFSLTASTIDLAVRGP